MLFRSDQRRKGVSIEDAALEVFAPKEQPQPVQAETAPPGPQGPVEQAPPSPAAPGQASGGVPPQPQPTLEQMLAGLRGA